jgi:TetR/AcrR family transcriptional regulator
MTNRNSRACFIGRRPPNVGTDEFMALGRTDLAGRREEIRDLILAGAIAEFAANGLIGASTQRIADRAGITKTRLHYYISSKEDLYEDALEHVTKAWVEVFDGITTTEDPRAFMASYIERKLRFCLQNPDAVRLFAKEVMRGAPMLLDRFAGSRETMQKASLLINSWADAGLIRRVDPVLLQFHIWAMTEHYALRQTEVQFMLDLPSPEDLDIALVVREMTDFVTAGLGLKVAPNCQP